jgi:hypothetical protein
LAIARDCDASFGGAPANGSLMSMLTDVSRAQIDRRKITHYLLSDEHSKGRHKARVLRALGFSVADWEVLHSALLQHANQREVVAQVTTSYGQRFNVRCVLPAPSGESTCFVTVWQREPGTNGPRFVTAYPA